MSFYREIDISKMDDIEEISVKQQDTNSRTIIFRVVDDVAPINLNNKTVTLFAKRRGDKEIFGIECTTSYEIATVVLPGNMLSKNDILMCELSVIGEDYTLSTPTFIINVMELIRDDDYIEGTSDFSCFERTVQNAINLPDADIVNCAVQRLENALYDLDQNYPAEGSVSIRKTNFFGYDHRISSSNLFDEDYIREHLALPPIEEGYDAVFTTDFIPIESPGTYLFSRTDQNHFETYSSIYWYDSEHNYITATEVHTEPENRIVESPQNARYVQFSMYNDEVNSAEHIIFCKVSDNAVFSNDFIPEYEEYCTERIVTISDPELLAMFEERDNSCVAAANDYTDLCISSMELTDGKSAYEIALEHGFSGTEAEWLESLKATVQEDDPTKYKSESPSMLRKGVCCGDSLTMGLFDDTEHIDASRAYPKLLSDLTNIPIAVLGHTGWSISDWWNYVNQNEISFVDSEFNFAIIFLGIVDALHDGWTSLAETNLINIINKFKTDVPGIKLFLVTPPAIFDSQNFDEVANGIRNIADSEDCYLIDLREYWTECVPENWQEYQVIQGGHFNANGHIRLAIALKSYLGYIIDNNVDDFKTLEALGTVTDQMDIKAAEAVENYVLNHPISDGKSAYETAVEHGFVGTEEEWLESLKGYKFLIPYLYDTFNWSKYYQIGDVIYYQEHLYECVKQGYADAPPTSQGDNYNWKYINDEEDAYISWFEEVKEVAKAIPVGGTTGQVLVKSSNNNYETEWVNLQKIQSASINANGHLIITLSDNTTVDCGIAKGENGTNGTNGKSAYEIAVEHGFIGTEAQWLESLKGESAYQIAVRNGFDGTESEWLESLKGSAEDNPAPDVYYEFSWSTNYSLGNKVKYNGKLYECMLAGMAQMPPTDGYDNTQWKYLGVL